MGRFVSQDPAFDGENWFIYCRDNPLKHIDLYGLETTFDDGSSYDLTPSKDGKSATITVKDTKGNKSSFEVSLDGKAVTVGDITVVVVKGKRGRGSWWALDRIGQVYARGTYQLGTIEGLFGETIGIYLNIKGEVKINEFMARNWDNFIKGLGTVVGIGIAYAGRHVPLVAQVLTPVAIIGFSTAPSVQAGGTLNFACTYSNFGTTASLSYLCSDPLAKPELNWERHFP